VSTQNTSRASATPVDFQQAPHAERNRRLDDIGDFIRRNADALEWTRELAAGLIDHCGRSPKMAADAVNSVIHVVLSDSRKKYRITPPTIQRFTRGGTKRPNSRLPALLVVWALSVRHDATEGRELVGRYFRRHAKLIRDFERILGWNAAPAVANGVDRAAETRDRRPPPPRNGRPRGNGHDLFYALMEYYKLDGAAQQALRPAVTGTYKLWRYSTQYEGEYVLGKVEITNGNGQNSPGGDHGLSPLRVRIRQMRKPRDKVRGGDEIVEGYFLSFRGVYMMLVRDALTFTPRCTIFRSNRRDVVGSSVDKNSIYPAGTDHIVDLIGFAMGMDADRMFFSPVYLELVDNKDDLARLDGTLDVVPESEVPRRILNTLKHYALHVW
jgi:hypothetical protein